VSFRKRGAVRMKLFRVVVIVEYESKPLRRETYITADHFSDVWSNCSDLTIDGTPCSVIVCDEMEDPINPLRYRHMSWYRVLLCMLFRLDRLEFFGHVDDYFRLMKKQKK
jgi:hypothetical protein